MAKEDPHMEVLLRSSVGTGSVYPTTKNRRTTAARLELREYDRKLRRHMTF